MNPVCAHESLDLGYSTLIHSTHPLLQRVLFLNLGPIISYNTTVIQNNMSYLFITDRILTLCKVGGANAVYFGAHD